MSSLQNIIWAVWQCMNNRNNLECTVLLEKVQDEI